MTTINIPYEHVRIVIQKPTGEAHALMIHADFILEWAKNMCSKAYTNKIEAGYHGPVDEHPNDHNGH